MAGVPCDQCTVDFGDVDVGLQEHRRFVITLACSEFGGDFAPQFDDGQKGFAMGDQLIPAPGGEGFAEVSFTSTVVGEKTDTIHFTASLQADVRANGVTP